MSNNAARKLKRRQVQRALESKVTVAPPAPAAPPVATPPAMRRMRLPMSDEQFNLLAAAQAQISAAQGQLETQLRVMLAQHHIVSGQVVEVEPGRPPKIVVLVPDDKKTSRKKR